MTQRPRTSHARPRLVWIFLCTLPCLASCKWMGAVFSRSQPPLAAGTLSQRSEMPKTLVLLGGGREGELGDENAWSFPLFRALLENGDTGGDGEVNVVVVSGADDGDEEGQERVARYFEYIGSTLAIGVKVKTLNPSTREDAEDERTIEVIERSDVVFLRGGDQGAYYRHWNDSSLERAIRAVASRGGSLGGTSAGAMSLGQYCLCGMQDLVSADVLADADTRYLHDRNAPELSGIKSDFLGFVPRVIVDTHFTERARLGRLAGIVAKAIHDAGDHRILGMGIDSQTGIVIREGKGKVFGLGDVTFVQESQKRTVLKREEGSPLVYESLVVDHLVDGWEFNLKSGYPEKSPLPGTETLPKMENETLPPPRLGDTPLVIDGDAEQDGTKFGWSIPVGKDAVYQKVAPPCSPCLNDVLGFVQAEDRDTRSQKQEYLFRALYDHPSKIGILAFSGSRIEKLDNHSLGFAASPNPEFVPRASIVLDGRTVTEKGPPSKLYSGARLDAQNHPINVALVNLTMHVLFKVRLDLRKLAP